MFIEKKILEYIRPSTTVISDEELDKKYPFKVLSLIISLVILVIAVIVSIDCNREVEGIVKYLFILVAAAFPSLYLTFYCIYRSILGNACY